MKCETVLETPDWLRTHSICQRNCPPTRQASFQVDVWVRLSLWLLVPQRGWEARRNGCESVFWQQTQLDVCSLCRWVSASKSTPTGCSRAVAPTEPVTMGQKSPKAQSIGLRWRLTKCSQPTYAARCRPWRRCEFHPIVPSLSPTVDPVVLQSIGCIQSRGANGRDVRWWTPRWCSCGPTRMTARSDLYCSNLVWFQDSG
jgi:hypothetical protein